MSSRTLSNLQVADKKDGSMFKKRSEMAKENPYDLKTSSSAGHSKLYKLGARMANSNDLGKSQFVSMQVQSNAEANNAIQTGEGDQGKKSNLSHSQDQRKQ